MPPATAGLVVAFSGGIDSTVLLHRLAAAKLELPIRAVHVCHHIYQPETKQWAQHCQQQCQSLGIAFKRLDVQVNAKGQGIEAAARGARYAALAKNLQPQETLVLAHHAQDQAETFLLQALRGSGVAGLAGMAAQQQWYAGYLWRPLLNTTRQAIEQYAQQHQLNWVDDPSNTDPQVARGFLHQALWPALNQRWPQASQTLSRSAHWCAQAHDLITEVIAGDLERVRNAAGRLVVEPLKKLSTFRQGEVIRLWLKLQNYPSPTHQHIEQILALLHAREHAGPQVAWRQVAVRLFNGQLYATPQLPKPPLQWQSSWNGQQLLQLPAGCGQLSASQPLPAAVTVKFRQGGEVFMLAHAQQHKTLKDFCREQRIPTWVRPRMPLLFLRGKLVGIADYWLAPELAYTMNGEKKSIIWQQEVAECR